MKKKTLEFLETHQSETPSKWREEAEWRRDNWSWLQHSQKIAVKVLLQMKQEGLTQKGLAERMNCTQQYVSKILKGKENMSLDTLSRLENALGINLIYDEQVAYPWQPKKRCSYSRTPLLLSWKFGDSMIQDFH